MRRARSAATALSVLSALAVVSAAAPAAAATLTFGTTDQSVSEWVEDGFRFVPLPGGQLTIKATGLPSHALLPQDGFSVQSLRLTALSGGSFRLASFDVESLDQGTPKAHTLVLTGTRSDGTTVVAQLTTDALPGLQTVVPQLGPVVAVEFASPSATTFADVIALDNVVANPVLDPLPLVPEAGVGTTTPIPGGTGSFTGFHPDPCWSPDPILFGGLGTGGQVGLYLDFGATQEGVVDTSAAIPEGTGLFTDFPGAFLGLPRIAFRGLGTGGQDGVYAGDHPDPCFLVADTGTAIPSGTGSFTEFGHVATDGSLVAFQGRGSGGQAGLYLWDAGTRTRVADTTTALPGGGGETFADYPVPCFDPGDPGVLALHGAGPTLEGIYLERGSGLELVVDTQTVAPGSPGLLYTDLWSPSLSQGRVAFVGEVGGGVGEGIFIESPDHPVPCWRVVDTATPIPGGGGATFTGFESVSLSGDAVAFVGLGSKGIYTTLGGPLRKVVAVGETLAGKTVADLSLGPHGLVGDRLVFWASFTDGSSGLFTVEAAFPVPAAGGAGRLGLGLALLLAGLMWLRGRRRLARA
jgi:hypothetical protein